MKDLDYRPRTNLSKETQDKLIKLRYALAMTVLILLPTIGTHLEKLV